MTGILTADRPRALGTATRAVRVSLVPRHESPAALVRAATTTPVPVGRPGGEHPSRTAPHSGALGDDQPPEAMTACCALAQAAIEVIRGARPLGQLVRWLTPAVYDAVGRRAALASAVRGTQPGMRTTIRRVRLCRFGTDAVEAAVVVDDGPQVRAVALRMELHRGAWRAVALEIG